MKRSFTILTAALALLACLAIPVGMWGQTTVASFSRSGSNNTTTGGAFTTTFSAKTGYYQDNNGDCYMQILNNSAYWTTTPTSISFAAKIGGGSGNTNLTDPVYVALLDVNGDVISGTQTAVTNKITTAGGDDYTISIPATNNVFGVKLSHNKQSGFNVRYYSFSLSYVAGGGDTPATYTVTFDAGSGSCTTSESSGAMNTSITLPTANPSTACAGNGWTFAGWATSAVTETTTAPTLFNGSYTISGNETLYAVYSMTNGQGSGQTVFNFAEIANANNWENSVAYTTVVIDPVTIQAQGGGNNGKWYTTGGGSWRMYSGGTVRVSAGDNAVTAVTSTPTCSFTISNGVATFSPSARTDFTNITVSYETSTTTYATSPTCDSSVATTTTISVPANFNTDIHNGANAGTLSATVTAGGSPISGAIVTWSSSNTGVATIDANGEVTLVAVGTTTITASYAGVADEYRESEGTYELTVTSSAPAATYTLANTIISGKTYIIVGFDDDDAYAMGEQRSNNRAGVGITVAGTTATGNANVHEVVITALEGDDAGKYTIEDGGYLYAASSSNNYLRTESTLDADANGRFNGKWIIVFGNDGEATITAQGSNTRNVMRFNPNNGSPIFACYSSTTGSLPKLYMKNETKTIVGYGDNHNVKNGWYLISSPIGDVLATDVGYMTTGSYDLYSFVQTEELEWRNYEANEFTTLEAGKGYLYANSTNVDLTFYGSAYTGTGTFPLVYPESTPDPFMRGWNLMGNPFATNATVDKPFCKMNNTGDGINATPVAQGSVIGPMEGVFVQATGANQSVTFTPTTSGAKKSPSINIDVTRNGEFLDRAIVSLSTDGSLCKLILSDNTTRVYFRHDQKDYAIITSENENEMPVSFKASRNGNYTLTVNTEEKMNYLHLIDNMTGNDVDLLVNPSYTFDASTKDYESRFRLVFAANNEDDASSSETFAFYSNGNWIVNNNAEAVLQLIDLTGRVISSETINGTVAKAINVTPGIYMLRLVNNNEVKTQKILVK